MVIVMYTIVLIQPWPLLNLKVTDPNRTTRRNQMNNERHLSASDGKEVGHIKVTIVLIPVHGNPARGQIIKSEKVYGMPSNSML